MAVAVVLAFGSIVDCDEQSWIESRSLYAGVDFDSASLAASATRLPGLSSDSYCNPAVDFQEAAHE